MIIKVLIERKVKKSKESEFTRLWRELRTRAISIEGYICGETLRSIDDPNRVLVISTWQSAEHWRKWEQNPRRLTIDTEIQTLLEEPAKISIYSIG
jgi:heme-degrading monooxygenase HmoA